MYLEESMLAVEQGWPVDDAITAAYAEERVIGLRRTLAEIYASSDAFIQYRDRLMRIASFPASLASLTRARALMAERRD